MATERLNAYIEDNAMRQSPTRMMVLERICALPQPFTGKQLEEVCAGEQISRGTVYNVLEVLQNAQIICPIASQPGSGHMQYELVTSIPSRMRYVCEMCGRKVEIRDKVLEKLIKTRHYYNFVPRRLSLLVYGVCKKCRLVK